MQSYVHIFGEADPDPSELGGKGAHLSAMTAEGLPVPPGFTLTVAAWRAWRKAGVLPEDVKTALRSAITTLESVTGRRFGGAATPLLVSARSGARISMPGMMDSLLNLGLTPESRTGLAAEYGAAFALDCERRFIPSFAEAALGLVAEDFEDLLEDYRLEKGLADGVALPEKDLRTVIDQFHALIRDEGSSLPQDAETQLFVAVEAVFRSWDSRRARTWRRLHGVPENEGLACTIQTMVFGNAGETSGTGVVFTRDPATGASGLYGEWLPNAQGEEVVSGLRTPQPLTEAVRMATGARGASLEITMPEVFKELQSVAARLERRFADMQDIEFTMERGALWLLQTRPGKRTARAALRIAVDLSGEGVISRDAALMRIDPKSFDQLLHPSVDPAARRDRIARGLPASPGAVTGEAVFSPEEAEALRAEGRKAILVRAETSPEDIHGMYAAVGVLTARGGMTSHAAVVARGLGKPCVCGASDIRVNATEGFFRTSDGRVVRRGDVISLDGGAGEALFGAVPTVEPDLDPAFAILMEWADARRRLAVRANADTPKEALLARRMGAEGIGLCRTEHTFFEQGRIVAMREMILASDESGRRAALMKLLPMQRSDFFRLFEAMQGLPVTIRLLDPPLHEFLPRAETEINAVAAGAGVDPEVVRARAAELKEFNPMLGRRGCRVGIAWPEIYEMQARAVFEAAIEAHQATGEPVMPEIMIPFVSAFREIEILKDRIDAVAEAVRTETGAPLDYSVGVMIETPRSALRADAIGDYAAFLSFGTNDLTQMMYGLSRDDAGRFMGDYVAKEVFPADPFHTLDEEGVGELLRIAVTRARAARPDIALGCCGEHGADPASIRFLEEIGLTYVSCSPYRAPIARLAAAQAAIASETRKGDA